MALERHRLTLGYAVLLGNLFMLQPFVVPTFGSNGMLYLLSYGIPIAGPDEFSALYALGRYQPDSRPHYDLDVQGTVDQGWCE